MLFRSVHAVAALPGRLHDDVHGAGHRQLREQRAEAARSTGLSGYEPEMREFLDYVLRAYEAHGIAELAPPQLRVVLKPTIELLAGIPSVVYGFMGVVLLGERLRGPASERPGR